MGLNRFNNGVFKDCGIIYVSANSHFSGHTEKTGLNNSKSSQKFHMSTWRSNDSMPGEGHYKKTNFSRPIMGNTPFDNYEHVEIFHGEKRKAIKCVMCF